MIQYIRPKIVRIFDGRCPVFGEAITTGVALASRIIFSRASISYVTTGMATVSATYGVATATVGTSETTLVAAGYIGTEGLRLNNENKLPRQLECFVS